MATDTPDREVGSLTIVVETDCDNINICDLLVELDDEYNFGQSCFGLNSRAYFRVYGVISYNCKATLGGPTKNASGVALKVEEEYVSFSDWSGSTEYPIWSVVSTEWVGRSLGTLHFVKGSSGFTADKTKSDGYGVCKITYNTKFDRWYLTSPIEADIIAYAVGKGVCWEESASVTIEFRETCTELDNYVTLVFKNFKTQAVLEGVAVTVDGIHRGNTDANGQIYLGLMGGGSHRVSATHADMTPTAGDLLGNDNFVVS